MNAVVIGRCLYYVFVENPQKLELWWHRLITGEWHIPDPPLMGHSPWTIAAICIILFPKLALGLSGFETGVAVMPLIRGRPDDEKEEPAGRIRNTRKLLMTAALIMSIYLITSSIVVSTVIEPDELLLPTGKAKDRALAYIAHGQGDAISPLFGNIFGTIYDASTIAILWFAGASAMAGLPNIIPRYLPRYGMAPEWLRSLPYLVIFLTGVNLLVTYVFDASVSAQGGAYATGVLVIMTSDSITSVIRRWREGSGPWYFRMPWYFILITLIFIYTTITIIIEKPAGIKIASCFIGTIFVTSFLSRFLRSTELRFTAFRFKDNESKFLWESLIGMDFPVIVPHRPGGRRLSTKEDIIRLEHRLTPDVPIVFVEVQRGDVSDFYFEPIMEVIEEEGRFIIRIAKCASISHVLAVIG
ncbi:MAG: hypothetical protein Q9M29_09095, partial [Mariprofundaceae bacterium]|nr:hypothetical protein [Mariprofundaceae bacterium]